MNDPIDCPFCGHPVDYVDYIYYCDICEVVWHSLEEIDADREDPPDALEWADVFTEDRTS